MDSIGVMKALGGSLLDLLVPRRCAGCLCGIPKKEGAHWCAVCREAIFNIRSPLCPVCGRPHINSPSASDHTCGDCLLTPPPFEGARSAALYSGFVRKRIHELKFGGRLHWVPSLVELLSDCWDLWDVGLPDGLVAVPLHVKRIQQRGFNQAALLAEALGKRMRRPVRHDILVRLRWTEPQTRLKREERLKNVARAFSVQSSSGVAGRSLLLIDDVFTTGSTILACAEALKDAGASRVLALTVARSVPDWMSAEPRA